MAETTPEAGSHLAPVDVAVAVIAGMSLIAAIAGLPLYADGAHYLFRLLVEGAPYVPDGRLAAVIPQLPALVAGRLGAEVGVVRLVFALAYGSLPVLWIWGCWLILRRRAPALMLFVALAALLGQINFSAVSELLLMLYLTWFLALALAVAPRSLDDSWTGRGLLWLSGPFLVLLHPLAVAPLLLLAFLSAATRRLDPASGPLRSYLTVWFLLCAFARVILSLSGVSGYESSHLSGERAVWYVLTQTWSQHGFLLAVTGIGLLAVAEATSTSPRLRLAGRSGWIATGVIAALTILWSWDILWGNGIRLKAGVTFAVSLLLLTCALLIALGWRARGWALQGIEAGIGVASGPGVGRDLARGWARIALACLIATAVLIGVKTTAWWTATRGLQNEITNSVGPCIRHLPEAPFGLQWPWMVIIDEWNAPMNALLFRPMLREPGDGELVPIPLLLPDDGCERLPETGVALMTPWLPVPWQRLDVLFGPLRTP